MLSYIRIIMQFPFTRQKYYCKEDIINSVTFDVCDNTNIRTSRRLLYFVLVREREDGRWKYFAFHWQPVRCKYSDRVPADAVQRIVEANFIIAPANV